MLSLSRLKARARKAAETYIPSNRAVQAPLSWRAAVEGRDVPLMANMEAREHFAEALLGLEGDGSMLERIEAVTAAHPGLAPCGDPASLHGPLVAAHARRPDNLSIRMALAESHAARGDKDAARVLAVSVIRDSRKASSGVQTRPAHGPTEAVPREFLNPALQGTFFHSVDLDGPFIEGSPKDALVTARETLRMHWPDVRGKSVLDIGAYGGWFSFEAERRGAARVTANDIYTWQVDFPKVWAWLAEEAAQGRTADPYHAPYPCNDPVAQPGRRGFDLTRRHLQSRVEPVFGTVDDTQIEPHDIVFLLGVLYHHENPVALLRRIFALTRETLVVETLSHEYTSNLDAPIWHFYGAHGDSTTVWAPSAVALRDTLLKVGFSRVELLYGWDTVGFAPRQEKLECRLWAHAYR